MVAVVGAVNGIVVADDGPVAVPELPLSPRVEELSVAVKDGDRVLAGIEGIEPVLRID
jgi:hypothetical protein